jgi:glucose-6-phosphate isomerase
MAAGEHINITEDRAVMHMALRAASDDVYTVDGENVVPGVHAVLKRMAAFAAQVRSGEWTGATGKTLTHVVSVGIGGSYLGPEFVYESLRSGKSFCPSHPPPSLLLHPPLLCRASSGCCCRGACSALFSKC